MWNNLLKTMKQSLIIALPFLMYGCQSSKIKISNYNSTCWLHTQTDVILKIYENDIFEYSFAYSDEKIIGNWSVKDDTLILFSDKFLEKREDLSPIVKNTNFDGLDKYLIRGKKLYAINKEGVEKHCYLVKLK
jgi:hypothetical protein